MVRLFLVTLLAEMSSHQSEELDVMGTISESTYMLLVDWFYDYPENNMYGTQFYILFFRCLRANHTSSLTAMIQKSKFVSRMLDAFKETTGDCDEEEEKKDGTIRILKPRHKYNFGQILMILNVIRLHSSTQTNTGFLRSYLCNHQKYKEFVPTLRDLTNIQNSSKFDIPKADPMFGGIDEGEDKLLGLNSDAGIDIGSAYAKKLGFVDCVEISEEEAKAEKPKKKKKKKKKKGKKKIGEGGGGGGKEGEEGEAEDGGVSDFSDEEAEP